MKAVFAAYADHERWFEGMACAARQSGGLSLASDGCSTSVTLRLLARSSTWSAVSPARLRSCLLQTWRRAPGLSGNSLVDEVAFNTWVDQVREIAATKDRSAIADQKIGEMMFHLPYDPEDGVWPHAVVRRSLQRLRSNHIEIGMQTAAFNSRGVTWRGLSDGGIQERDLA